MTGKQALKALYETMPLVFGESRKATHYLEIIEKEIKALDIINKNVNLIDYLEMCLKVWETITQEEYDIVKDVLTQK